MSTGESACLVVAPLLWNAHPAEASFDVFHQENASFVLFSHFKKTLKFEYRLYLLLFLIVLTLLFLKKDM